MTNLDDVFDDPAHGDVGRDRLGVHFAWEGVLLLAVLVLGYLLFANYREAVSGEPLKALLVSIAALGLLAFGASISLRVAAPNLAIGSIAVASGLYYADKSNSQGLVSTAIWPLMISLAVGVGIAVLVVGFHVPGWAGSLAATLVVIAWIQNKFSDAVTVSGDYDPTDHTYYLLGGFIVLSLVAGLLGIIKPVRRGIGRFRPTGDPAERRGGMAGTVTSIGLVCSTVLASIAGIVLAAAAGSADESFQPMLGLEWTALALGAALVGGVSAFGRRGGVFGTILGTALVALVTTYGEYAGWRISVWALAAGTVGTGLVVTRLVETFGRPLTIGDGPDDWSDVGVGGTGWSTAPTSDDPWAGLSSAPSSPPPTTTTTTQWGDTDRWR